MSRVCRAYRIRTSRPGLNAREFPYLSYHKQITHMNVHDKIKDQSLYLLMNELESLKTDIQACAMKLEAKGENTRSFSHNPFEHLPHDDAGSGPNPGSVHQADKSKSEEWKTVGNRGKPVEVKRRWSRFSKTLPDYMKEGLTIPAPVAYDPDVLKLFIERLNQYWHARTGVMLDLRFGAMDGHYMSPVEACLLRNQYLMSYLDEQPIIVVVGAGVGMEVVTARYQMNPKVIHVVDSAEFHGEEGTWQNYLHNVDELVHKHGLDTRRIINHNVTAKEFYAERNLEHAHITFVDPPFLPEQGMTHEIELRQGVEWVFDHVYVPMLNNNMTTDIFCMKTRYPTAMVKIVWDEIMEKYRREHPDLAVGEMLFYQGVAVNPYRHLSDPELEAVQRGQAVHGVFYWIFFSSYDARIKAVVNSDLWNQINVRGSSGVADVKHILKPGDDTVRYASSWIHDHLNQHETGTDAVPNTQLPRRKPVKGKNGKQQDNKDYTVEDHRWAQNFKASIEIQNKRYAPEDHEAA